MEHSAEEMAEVVFRNAKEQMSSENMLRFSEKREIELQAVRDLLDKNIENFLETGPSLNYGGNFGQWVQARETFRRKWSVFDQYKRLWLNDLEEKKKQRRAARSKLFIALSI